jgi:hypothetical protein
LSNIPVCQSFDLGLGNCREVLTDGIATKDFDEKFYPMLRPVAVMARVV